MSDDELERLYDQRQTNNTHITRLLNLVDKLQIENSQMSRRINLLQSNPRNHNARNLHANLHTNVDTDEPINTNFQDYTTLPEVPENTDNSDLVFYFYLPRREDRELSVEIINRETTNTVFNQVEHPNNLSCPISLETFHQDQNITMINHCGHIFNKEHLARWFETKTTCPICRHNLQETPPLNRLASMASRMLGSALSSSMSDIFNELQR